MMKKKDQYNQSAGDIVAQWQNLLGDGKRYRVEISLAPLYFKYTHTHT